MKQLLKYLKKYAGWIVVIFALLVVQAMCDLSLPSYTSNIVNVGIQQSGIESPVPDVIRKSEMEKLALFMDSGDSEAVLKHYKMLSKAELSGADYDSYISEYPALAYEDLYVLDKDGLSKKEKEALEDDLASKLSVPEMITSMFEQDSKNGSGEGTSDQMAKMQQGILANMPEEMLAAAKDETGAVDMFKLFSIMPQESVRQITGSIVSQLKEMPEMIVEQSGVQFVKEEYKAVGINIQSIQTRYIIKTGAKMVLLALVVMAAASFVTLIASRIAAAVSRELRSRVFHKVIDFSNQEFDTFSTASLITRSTNDIQQVQMLVVMTLRLVLYAPIMALGGIYKVFTTNAKMSWILALGIGVLLVVVGTLFVTVMPKFKKMQQLVDRVNLVTREILSGIPVIRAFSTEKHEMKRFDKANKDLTKNMLFVNRVMSCMMPVMMLIMNLLTILIVWVGAGHIDSGAMQVGDMMAFIQYAMMIIMSFLMLSMISVMLPRASVSAVRVDEILTTECSVKDKADPEAFDAGRKGYVEFNHVNFKYPGADENVLEDIDFTAKPGETTAIIGSTGSGKSTLIQLIPRFFDVTGGSITVDGRDVRNVSSKDLRDRIGYVPQKGVLFSGTIESNIKYFDETASDEVMERAARIAQAKDFIEEKPDQYDSVIAQGGDNVSGGQKQRLSIARAIAKDPEIYIFDDSFSALDYKTDAVLRRVLREETKDSTVIIVAQRISTILNAEQIIVLDEGRIAGKGTHKELLKSCEVYRQIAMSQLSEKELELDGSKEVLANG